MPFKKFPGEDGEARGPPVAFGPPIVSQSNGNESMPFKRAANSDGDESVRNPAETHNSRRKSPTRSSTVARGGSPSKAFPRTNGSVSSSPLPFGSTAHDQTVQTELAFLPSYQSTSNAGSLLQSSPVRIDNALTKFSSKVHAQDATTISTPPYTSNAPSLPIFSRRNTSETPEVRVRHNTPQEQSSRFFASAIQQLRATQDSGAISLTAEQQREEMAKGRRLRRFNDPSAPVAFHMESQNVADQGVNKRAEGSSKILMIEARDGIQGLSAEPEGQDGVGERDGQSTEPILGNCPDMCPESERLERERKGDLDKLERVDGDRNQTSRDIAVKKYTRTAEKHASLIRPISVLLKTMKHLLNLLNRGYDEDLLNLHNFLWDRMRAIRMDLRMQHIFNEQAVVMHEQMIRFHILAMHELCEYAKGEGFTEGFDAHLNIEQMNKASVDLFHMYDDLRKVGITFVSEAEFRGYYALLKLDKHPGYLVEPAELSLDLAKMTPEMRSTPEVQFARKVARACRSGNYLAFFRLARDASYLQACLMHAHFSKLRSEAMVSLHSALQRNQGIPIMQVEDWLGMEGEEIEALLEYHGFSLKSFEEPYLVKEGSFINQGQAFQTRRSRLVEEKRSHILRDDVLLSGQVKASTVPVFERISSLRRQSDLPSPTALTVADEEMPDYEEEQVPQKSSIDHSTSFLTSPRNVDAHLASGEVEMQVPIPVFQAPDVRSRSIPEEAAIVRSVEPDDIVWSEVGKRRKSTSPLMEHTEFAPKTNQHILTFKEKKLRMSQDSPVSVASLQATFGTEPKIQELEADDQGCQKEKEHQAALKAEIHLRKVRLLLRKWRARAADKAEERQWREEKLEAALNSFHVGLPVQKDEKVFAVEAMSGNPGGDSSSNHIELDFMHTEDRRVDKIEKMWAALDVLEVVSPILKQRNPSCKFLCWKLVMYTGHDLDSRFKERHDSCGEWLVAKLLHRMPSGQVKDGGNSADSICMASRHTESKTPVFYFGRELHLRDVESQPASKGASGALFLVSKNASLDDERRRLHASVNGLQVDSNLPLLVVYSGHSEIPANRASTYNNGLDDSGFLAKVLGLDNLDRTKVACWKVLPIIEGCATPYPSDHVSQEKALHSLSGSRSKGFFSEELLKKGLSWLVSKAPPQPNLRGVHVQDLVFENLQLCVNKLVSTMDPSQVTPQMCVKLFNEALLKAADEVNSAATGTHLNWPPEELRLVLKDLTEERALPIPSPGWNETPHLQPIIKALSFSQLPEFPLMSIPTSTLRTHVSLKRQKDVLEHALHSYVNQICRSNRADPLTLQVVDSIIQKGCLFKQTALGRLLIPNWVMIFQQLYHIRLALLCGEPPAIVWIQQTRAEESNGSPQMMLSSTDSFECPGPTLDEMIDMEIQESSLRWRPTTLYKDMAALDMDWEGGVSQYRLEMMAEAKDRRQQSMVTFPEYPSDPRPEFREAIELCMTEGELKLESMVSDFCKRVDQQVAEAAKLSGTEHARQQPVMVGDRPHSLASSDLAAGSCGDDCPSSYSVASGSWGASDGADSLTQLLQHCENVQNSIDKTLMECFGI